MNAGDFIVTLISILLGMVLFLLTIIGPIVGFVIVRQRLRSHRLQRKLRSVRGRICLICGYDAHESELRCPECGSIIISEATLTPKPENLAETAVHLLQMTEPADGVMDDSAAQSNLREGR